MNLSQNEVDTLRGLAIKYMEIATKVEQRQTMELWKSLNRSKMQRPMVLIDQLPWNELNINDELTCVVTDSFWKNIEIDLRMKLFKWKYFPVDMVIEPYITIPQSIIFGSYGLDANVEKLSLTKGETAPSVHYTSVLNEYDDIEKIKDLTFSINVKENKKRIDEAKYIFEDIAPIKQSHGVLFHLGVWDNLTAYMGIEDAYFNIVDRPDFVHACMERITQATLAGIKNANKLKIHDDISNLCHCSHIYTDELLPDFGQGKGPISKNSWAFGLAQLFTSVSPKVTEEFELPYITRMAEKFGMIYYGCCDRLDDRLDIIKKIPNLKKISCSPWSDRKRFAENIGETLVMSNKPTPAFIASKNVNWDEVRKDLQLTYDLAKSNKVNLEFILKDISTVSNQLENLIKWAKIAKEIVNA